MGRGEGAREEEPARRRKGGRGGGREAEREEEGAEPSARGGGRARGRGRKRARTIGPKRQGQTSGCSAARAGAAIGLSARRVLPDPLRPRTPLLRSRAWDSEVGCPLPLPRGSSIARRSARDRPACQLHWPLSWVPPLELPSDTVAVRSGGLRDRSRAGGGGGSETRRPGARTDARRPCPGAAGTGSRLPAQTRPTGWATPARRPPPPPPDDKASSAGAPPLPVCPPGCRNKRHLASCVSLQSRAEPDRLQPAVKPRSSARPLPPKLWEQPGLQPLPLVSLSLPFFWPHAPAQGPARGAPVPSVPGTERRFAPRPLRAPAPGAAFGLRDRAQTRTK